jgi:hypothetical protein
MQKQVQKKPQWMQRNKREFTFSHDAGFSMREEEWVNPINRLTKRISAYPLSSTDHCILWHLGVGEPVFPLHVELCGAKGISTREYYC